jgi:hypothetical protein
MFKNMAFYYVSRDNTAGLMTRGLVVDRSSLYHGATIISVNLKDGVFIQQNRGRA